MCGIFGVISKTETTTSETLSALTNLMFERGPDGYGEFIDEGVALSMRRLSIIDVNHGWQPFFSHDSRFVIFQNGEIYNYKSLKLELESIGYNFKTNSDTEVLAHGFHAWGVNVFKKIDGMYAISIYDTVEKKIFLSRDRFGEKPFYYSYDNDCFSFSSTTRNLTCQQWIGSQLNPDSLNSYFAIGFVPGEKTIFKNIFKILPGCYLEVDTKKISFKSHRYYELTDKMEGNSEKLEELLPSIVNSRLVADVPVGVFLSGGLDSSVIAALACKEKKNIKTMSIGFKDKKHDESTYAKEVADFIGSDHSTYLFNELDFRSLLPKVASKLDEPIADQALLPVFMLCEAAKKEVKVVLSGEGADELFGGYGYYNSNKKTSLLNRLKKMIRSMLYRKSVGFLREHKLDTQSGFPLISDKHFRDSVIQNPQQDKTFDSYLIGLSKKKLPIPFDQIVDIKTWLTDNLLVKLDRVTMCHSIEGRAPYLSPQLISYLNSRTSSEASFFEDKVLLRQYAKTLIPESILNRPKQGFVLPMDEWLKSWIRDSDLNGLTLSIPSFINSEHLKQTLRRQIDIAKLDQRLVFAIAFFLEWHNQYLLSDRANSDLILKKQSH